MSPVERDSYGDDRTKYRRWRHRPESGWRQNAGHCRALLADLLKRSDFVSDMRKDIVGICGRPVPLVALVWSPCGPGASSRRLRRGLGRLSEVDEVLPVERDQRQPLSDAAGRHPHVLLRRGAAPLRWVASARTPQVQATLGS